MVCVVEQPRDLMALEQSNAFKGHYHVLLGRISPLEGIGPESLTIKQLVQRVDQGEIKELIMATNPTVEGDGTSLHISQSARRLSRQDHATGKRNYHRKYSGIHQQGDSCRCDVRSKGILDTKAQ